MPRKIRRLSVDEEASFVSFARAQAERALECGPLTERERETIVAGVQRCYGVAGLPWHDNVLWAASPLSGALAATALRAQLAKRRAPRGHAPTRGVADSASELSALARGAREPSTQLVRSRAGLSGWPPRRPRRLRDAADKLLDLLDAAGEYASAAMVVGIAAGAVAACGGAYLGGLGALLTHGGLAVGVAIVGSLGLAAHGHGSATTKFLGALLLCGMSACTVCRAFAGIDSMRMAAMAAARGALYASVLVGSAAALAAGVLARREARARWREAGRDPLVVSGLRPHLPGSTHGQIGLATVDLAARAVGERVGVAILSALHRQVEPAFDHAGANVRSLIWSAVRAAVEALRVAPLDGARPAAARSEESALEEARTLVQRGLLRCGGPNDEAATRLDLSELEFRDDDHGMGRCDRTLPILRWLRHHARLALDADAAARLDAYDDASSGSFWWPHEDFVIISEPPSAIHRERTLSGAGRRLHHSDGPAAIWRDGFRLHCSHGVLVPAEVFERAWDPAAIERAPIEHRWPAVERMGVARYVREAALRCVASAPDPGNPPRRLELYEAPPWATRAFRILLMTDGSPDSNGLHREHGELVPAAMADPVEAAAWQYGCSVAMYRALVRRT